MTIKGSKARLKEAFRGILIILALFVHFSLEIQLPFVLSFQSTTQSRLFAEKSPPTDRRNVERKNRRVT